MLSKRRFDELIMLEDRYWDLKAKIAEEEGFLTDQATKQILKVNRDIETEHH